jgi:hypothetical protein
MVPSASGVTANPRMDPNIRTREMRNIIIRLALPRCSHRAASFVISLHFS